MNMPANPFKAALWSGRSLTGIRTSLCSPAIVELLSDCGFDYVYIDTEHTPGDVKTVQAQLWAMRGSSSLYLVRPGKQRSGDQEISGYRGAEFSDSHGAGSG